MTFKMAQPGQIEETVGGIRGHVLRRIFHILILFTPLIYYAYGSVVGGWFALSAKQLLWAIIFISVVCEIFRIKFGWVLFGQRKREGKKISALTWGIVSVCLVLLLSPSKIYAIPIIWSCAIVDPILGELRRRLASKWVIWIGIVCVMLIWWVATWWWGTPWLLALLMGPLIVGLEWPNFRWIDDNALMQLIPLFVIMLLYA